MREVCSSPAEAERGRPRRRCEPGDRIGSSCTAEARMAPPLPLLLLLPPPLTLPPPLATTIAIVLRELPQGTKRGSARPSTPQLNKFKTTPTSIHERHDLGTAASRNSGRKFGPDT